MMKQGSYLFLKLADRQRMPLNCLSRRDEGQ